jgi:hypothetical protein
MKEETSRYVRQQVRAQIEVRDLKLINKVADELNEEVGDILRYQQAWAQPSN